MTAHIYITRDLVLTLKKEFLQLDADGDGQVLTEEVERLLHSMRRVLKVTQGDIRCAVKAMDRNGDGVINIKEYLHTSRNTKDGDLIYRALAERAKIRKEFTAYDIDGNGIISKEEFLKKIKKRRVVSPDQIDGLLKEISENDADGNGEIDFEEFVALMCK